ncbi:MAG: rRNA maturation RNase YbeY [Candidatus Omnitrophota bacterium]
MKKPAIAIRSLQNRIFFAGERRKAGAVNSLDIKNLVFKTLSLRPLNWSGQISILLVGDKMIRDLNFKYLDKNRPTDVLAFDLSRGKGDITCEIVVSTDAAFYNSRIYKTSPVYETYLYVVHGLLHILGFDDRAEIERKFMQKKAEKILFDFNPLNYKL